MSKGSFISNTLSFSLATFFSRILGYLRDATIAFFFGANPLTDAFFIAWKLPNTFRQLLGEGSFNAVFIPIYTEELKNNPKSAQEYINSLFTYYILFITFLTLTLIIFADFVVKILAPGFIEKSIFDETVNLIRLLLPYLILVSIVSFFMALLNTKDRFFLPAFTPALLNLSFIVSAFIFANSLGIYSLVIGALFGGFLQVITLIPVFFKEGFRIRFTLKVHPSIKKTLKKLAPAFASFGVNQFSFIIDTIIASFLLGGAISYLYYANRIFQLPIGVFAIGLGNALLVSLSKHFTNKDFKAFTTDFNRGIQLSVFISLPATVGMIVLGKEIIELLLVRGKFTDTDATFTNLALIGYSLGLLGYAVSRPFKSAFFSTGDTKTPLYATIFGVIVGIVFAILFGFILNMGVFGLALASSMVGYSTTLYLYLKSNFVIDLKKILITFSKVLLASILMGIAVYIFKGFFESVIVKVFGGILIGATCYFITVKLLKEESFDIFVKTLKRKKG